MAAPESERIVREDRRWRFLHKPQCEGNATALGTAGKRWKFRRNLVIYIATKGGMTQRFMADVFDLPHSRIAAIVKEFKEKYEKKPTPRE